MVGFMNVMYGMSVNNYYQTEQALHNRKKTSKEYHGNQSINQRVNKKVYAPIKPL